MKIAIGSDHRGYKTKDALIKFLKRKGFNVKDFGTFSGESCDYPLIGLDVAKAISKGKYDRGILICMSGVGFSIVANKIRKVRAVLCRDKKTAVLSREHNDSNVITFGAEFTPLSKIKEFVLVWLNTPFLGERHLRRINQIKDIEKGNIK